MHLLALAILARVVAPAHLDGLALEGVEPWRCILADTLPVAHAINLTRILEVSAR